MLYNCIFCNFQTNSQSDALVHYCSKDHVEKKKIYEANNPPQSSPVLQYDPVGEASAAMQASKYKLCQKCGKQYKIMNALEKHEQKCTGPVTKKTHHSKKNIPINTTKYNSNNDQSEKIWCGLSAKAIDKIITYCGKHAYPANMIYRDDLKLPKECNIFYLSVNGNENGDLDEIVLEKIETTYKQQPYNMPEVYKDM